MRKSNNNSKQNLDSKMNGAHQCATLCRYARFHEIEPSQSMLFGFFVLDFGLILEYFNIKEYALSNFAFQSF